MKAARLTHLITITCLCWLASRSWAAEALQGENAPVTPTQHSSSSSSSTNPLPELQECAYLSGISLPAGSEDLHRRCNLPSSSAPPLPAPPKIEEQPPAEIQVIAEAVLEVLPEEQHNFALIRDGAKVVAYNPGAKRVNAILDDDSDTFMRNECREDKWVVIELSEVTKVSRIELAQNELYSSRVRGFEVRGRQSHPRTDNVDTSKGLNSTSWKLVGSYEAEKAKGVQEFLVENPTWVRFLLFRFLTHHGSEPVCALNGLAVYGKSAAQELEDHLAADEAGLEVTDSIINGGGVDEWPAMTPAAEPPVPAAPSTAAPGSPAVGDGEPLSSKNIDPLSPKEGAASSSDGQTTPNSSPDKGGVSGGSSGGGGSLDHPSPGASLRTDPGKPDLGAPSSGNTNNNEANRGSQSSTGVGSDLLPVDKKLASEQTGGDKGRSKTIPDTVQSTPPINAPDGASASHSSGNAALNASTVEAGSSSSAAVASGLDPAGSGSNTVKPLPPAEQPSVPVPPVVLPPSDTLEQLPVPKSKAGGSLYEVLVQEIRATKAQQRLMVKAIDGMQRDLTALSSLLANVKAEYELSEKQLFEKVDSRVESQLRRLENEVVELRKSAKSAAKREHAALSLLAMLAGALVVSMRGLGKQYSRARRAVAVLAVANGAVGLLLHMQGGVVSGPIAAVLRL